MKLLKLIKAFLIRLIILSGFTLLVLNNLNAQVVSTTYYKNENLTKETSLTKAKFSKTAISYADNTLTTEIKDLEKSKTIRRFSFKNGEPVGLWLLEDEGKLKSLDYNFELLYFEKDKINCKSSVNPEDYLKDGVEPIIEIPKIVSGEQTLGQFIQKHLKYPEYAKVNAIEENVLINISVNKKGEITDIIIQKGVHKVLDKEAVRVIRLLKFSGPYLINGKPEESCMQVPIGFRLSK